MCLRIRFQPSCLLLSSLSLMVTRRLMKDDCACMPIDGGSSQRVRTVAVRPRGARQPAVRCCACARARRRLLPSLPPGRLPLGTGITGLSRALVAATYAGADFAAALANGNANATQSRGALSRMPEAAKLTGKEGG
jgi:hypothetical protein